MKAEIKPVLLVDDNPKDVELTLVALDEHNLANEVIVVNNGEEALDYMYRRGVYQLRAEGNPAVVLLDINMPKVNGLEVLERLKKDENLKQVPVVMLTGSQEERDLMRSYEMGVNAYVVKPVDFAALVEQVKYLGLFWAVTNHPPPGSVRRKRR